MTSTHLVILSDRAALSWVVASQRMALPPNRASLGRSLQRGDEVLLYTTRGCFGNPNRDYGRVMGVAAITSSVSVLSEPVCFSGRSFTEGFDLAIRGLAPFREGLVFRDLVPQLEAFPDPATWSVRMRRPVLTLSPTDADLIRRELHPFLRDYDEVANQYSAAPAR